MTRRTPTPQLETPFPILHDHLFIPHDALFFHEHIANIPTTIDLQTFQLTICGRAKYPYFLSVEPLGKYFEAVAIAAVCQWAGHSLRFFEPRVADGQWEHKAPGNGIWAGEETSSLRTFPLPQKSMLFRQNSVSTSPPTDSNNFFLSTHRLVS